MNNSLLKKYPIKSVANFYGEEWLVQLDAIEEW